MDTIARTAKSSLDSDSAADQEVPVDYRDLAGFALRSTKRRPILAAAVFATTLGAAVFAAFAMPRTYESDVKILAQRNLVMAALGNPRRSIPNDADAPTRGVSEAILDKENLVALVKDANLLDRWMATRTPILRAKDQLMTRAFGPMSEADRQRAMIEIVEKKMQITTDDGVIHITVQWDDPQLTYDLVTLAQTRFLSHRSDVETSAIVETIAILETEATKDRAAVAADLAETMRVASQSAPSRPRSPSLAGAIAPIGAPRVRVGETAAQDAQLARELATKLEEKRRAIRNLEEPWQRNLADLRAKLTELKVTYAPAHPLVIEQERRIDDANVVPPALAALRFEEKALLAQADAIPESVTRTLRPSGGSGFAAPDPLAVPAFDIAAARDDPPELVAARARLQTSTRKYEDLVDRIDAARIELETTRAAFKYRYRVTQPAEMPKKAIKPSVPILLGGGFFLATLLAFVASIARDLSAGRFLESWQARRHLKVPMLAEVNEP